MIFSTWAKSSQALLLNIGARTRDVTNSIAQESQRASSKFSEAFPTF